MEKHGWARIIKSLNDSLKSRLNTSLSVAAENDYGMPVFTADTSNLTPDQADLANKMVARATAIAQETCAICGRTGRLSYKVEPPASGIRCDKHRGDWQAL